MSVSGGYTMFPYLFISSVQSLSCVQLFVTPQTAAHQASLSITKSWGLLKLIEFYHYHRDGNAIQPSHPLSSPSPAFNLSQHQSLFQWVSSSHQVDKVLELQLQHQPFQWIFRTDFLEDWWVWSLCSPRDSQSLLQDHNSKASVLQHLAFFMVQLSHLHMTTGKTIALTRWTFVGKGMSLLLKMLSRFVIVFLPRSKHLLISWLQSPFAVIEEPPK